MRTAIIASLFTTSVLAQSQFGTTSDFASNPAETGTDGVTNSHTALSTGLFNMTTTMPGIPAITTGTTRPVSNSGAANATGVGASGNSTSGNGTSGSGSGSSSGSSSSDATLTFIGGGFLASCVLLGIYANGH